MPVGGRIVDGGEPVDEAAQRWAEAVVGDGERGPLGVAADVGDIDRSSSPTEDGSGMYEWSACQCPPSEPRPFVTGT